MMPRYFFDSFDGDTWVDDDEGLQLEHDKAAGAEAQEALSNIAKDELPGDDARQMIVRVRDDNGPVLEARLDLQTVWLK